MTARQAIDTLNAAMPNGLTDAQKLDWLRELDLIITNELYGTHCLSDSPGSVPDYNENTVLRAEAPHDAVYLPFLMAKVDFLNAEHERFNNDVRVFRAALDTLSAHFNRAHTPLSAEVIF